MTKKATDETVLKPVVSRDFIKKQKNVIITKRSNWKVIEDMDMVISIWLY